MNARMIETVWRAVVVIVFAGCGHRTAASGGERAPAAEARAEASAVSFERCGDSGVAVQVLGSGGPIAGPNGRSSTSYLVWAGGKARLMVDMGQGATRGFGMSGARLETLDAVLISHLHADHASDLVAFAKSASFQGRSAPLTVLGPAGNDQFPSIEELLQNSFGARGAYRYLHALDKGASFSFEAQVIDAARDGAPVDTPVADDLTVRSLGVKHGPVPALAYRVVVDGKTIVFMGDQTAESQGFVDLLRGAHLFVAHMAIGREADDRVKALHATPARIGEVAAAAHVSRLLLSHLMSRALEDFEGSLGSVRRSYAGPLTVAEDGLCVPVESL